ncbi:MAG TPA: hypothetical protein VF009_02615 [Solirubrobacterales bacterium]
MSTPAFEGKRPAPTTWEEYLDGVLHWLHENWGPETHCPYCGNPQWRIGQVRAIAGANNWPAETDESGFFPVVPVSCTQCGHIVSIQALWIFEPQELRILMESMGALDANQEHQP